MIVMIFREVITAFTTIVMISNNKIKNNEAIIDTVIAMMTPDHAITDLVTAVTSLSKTKK